MVLNKTLFSFLFLIFITVVLLLQSQLPIYSTHLSTDIYVFLNRAQYFTINHNLKYLDNNEYQPGATLFFILLEYLQPANNSFDVYKSSLFAVNILIVFLLAYIYKKGGVSENITLFALLLLLTGPIILFRFDLLVSLLVVLSIFLWNKNKPFYSMIALAFAVTVKIYPVIFLPYILIMSYKSSGIKSVFQMTSYFVGTITIFLVSYLLFFQTNIPQITNSLNYHALKPVSTDNLYGMLINFYNVYNFGQYPQIISAYGTNGLDNKDIVLPLGFYNYFWVIPFLILHIPLLLKRVADKKIDILFFLINLLIFLIFTKSIAPQYMIWFITLIPLLQPKEYLAKSWEIIIILIFFFLFFYQYIYPLNYNVWLNGFRPPYNFYGLQLINILRNIFMSVTAVILLIQYLRNRVVS